MDLLACNVPGPFVAKFIFGHFDGLFYRVNGPQSVAGSSGHAA